MSDQRPDERPTAQARAPQPWVKPEIIDLPPLTDLTLQTGPGVPGGGGTGGGGSVVF